MVRRYSPEGGFSAILAAEDAKRQEDIGDVQEHHQEVFRPRKAIDEVSVPTALDLDKPQAKVYKIAAVGVDEIVKSAARRMGEKKAQEYLDSSGILKRFFVRPSEKAIIDKFTKEAEREIRANRNLMASIKTRLDTHSDSAPLDAGSDLATYCIMEVLVENTWDTARVSEEAMWGLREKPVNVHLREGKDKYETREHVAHQASLDAKAAELIAKYVFGEITDRNTFDQQAEEEIFQKLTDKAKLDKQKMFASNLFYLAENYKKSIEQTLSKVGKEFTPAEKTKVKNYLQGCVKLDINLAQSKADLHRKKTTGVMRAVEMAVDFTQMPYLTRLPPNLSNTRFGKWLAKIPGLSYISGAISSGLDRAWGLTVGNPIVYGYLGNRLGYAAASGVGAKAALGIGLTAVGLGPGMVMALGAALGAGSYLGMRAAVEKLRDTRRREDQAVLGQGSREHMPVVDARNEGIARIKQLAQKPQALTTAEKQEIARWAAALRVQETHEVNLLGVSEGEGGRYKTNLLVVDDLRREIFTLLEARSGEFGATGADKKQQALAFTDYVQEQEKELIKLIEKADKEKGREILRRALLVGTVGGLCAGAASVLTPEAMKLIKAGSNRVVEHFGGAQVFDTNYSTFAEQLYNKTGETYGYWEPLSTNFYEGEMSPNHFAFMHGKTELSLPVGYGTFDLSSGSDHFVGITDPQGKALPGVRIPVDATGKISDPHAFDVLRDKLGWQVVNTGETTSTTIASGGAKTGGGWKDWITDLKAKGYTGVEVAPVNKMNFLDNPVAGTTNPNVQNELNLFINKDAVTGEIIMKSDLTQYGSWKGFTPFEDNGSGGLQLTAEAKAKFGTEEFPDLPSLFSKGEIKFFFTPKGGGETVFCDINTTTGEARFPSGMKMEEIFDATGKVRTDVDFGTAWVRDGGSGAKNLIVLNSEHGTGKALDFAGQTQTQTEKVGLWDLRPPKEYGALYGPAGYRRQQDTEIAERREKVALAKIIKANKARLEAMSPQEKRAFLKLRLKQALLESGEIVDKPFNEVSHLYSLSEADQTQLLNDMLDDYGVPETDRRSANPTPAPTSAPANHGHGHGHDHDHDHAPAPTPTPPQKQTLSKEGLLNLLTVKHRESLKPKEKANKERLKILNERQNNRGPHLEFLADDDLLKGRALPYTNQLAESILNYVVAEGLDANKYPTLNYRVKISEQGPFGWAQIDGIDVLTVNPVRSAQDTALQILEKVKGADGLEYRYQDLPEINNEATNKEPLLRFSYDPAVVVKIGFDAINDYSKRLHKELRTRIGTSVAYKDVLLRINFFTPGTKLGGADSARAEVDAHGYTILNLPYADNVRRDAEIILREMKRLTPETAPKANRQFLETINALPGNLDPYAEISMPEDKLIVEMGPVNAEAYAKFVATEFRTYINDVMSRANPAEQQFFKRQPIKLRIMQSGNNRGFQDITDGTFVLTVKPNLNANALKTAFRLQYNDCLRNVNPNNPPPIPIP
jgi:hypothetical protein